MRDEIVEEVRAAREAYAAQFNFDLQALCADLKKSEKARGRKTVSFSTEPAREKTGTP